MTEQDNQNPSDKTENKGGSGKTIKKSKKKAAGRSRGASASSSKVTSQQTDSNYPSTTTAAASDTDSSPQLQGNSSTPALSGNALAVAALVLSLLALIGAGYAWYQTAVNARLTGGEQNTRIAAMEKRIEASGNNQSGVAEQFSELRQLVARTESGLNAQISDLRAAESKQQQQLVGEVASVRDEFGTLTSSIGDVKKELGSSVDKWGQREVEHLLTIANQRLQLADDPEAARAALQLADERLKQLDDPTLLNVRQTLSTEIAELADVSAPDIVSATGTITLLSQTLGDLPLKGETRVPDAAISGQGDDSAAIAETESAGEQIVNIGRTFFADLGSLVQVEKDGEPVAPTITTDVARMIVARGRLMLEGAQVALVRSQPDVFHDRLDAASVWVAENFEGDSDQTKKWLSQLDELKGFSPKVAYPDISGSLKALRSSIAAEVQNQ